MLWICTSCSCAYSVGAPRCPECGGTEYVEQGSPEHEAWLAARSATEAKTKPAKALKEAGSDAGH